ncbi:MAG: hypothetical protein ACYDA8_22530 [Deferrisomatales bacterium]
MEVAKNYIPASEAVRREYAHLLAEEYVRYVAQAGLAGARR